MGAEEFLRAINDDDGGSEPEPEHGARASAGEPEHARYITVTGWDTFQHPDVLRSDRAPRWIKNWTDLLRRDEYRRLTGHDRAVLHGIWLEYASTRARLRLDTLSLTHRLGLRVTTATLERLNHAGFLTFTASAPQAERKQPASLDKRRTEGFTKNPSPRATSEPWRCTLDGHQQHYTYDSRDKLSAHLQNVHWIDDAGELERLLEAGAPAGSSSS